MSAIFFTPRFALHTASGDLDAVHFHTPPGSTTTSGIALLKEPFGRSANATPVRLQSSCLFSEAFHTIDCDCAKQLRRSIEIVISEGGIVVYTFQEGRGAGLEMKCRGIALEQARGISTVDAYAELNLPSDLRDYSVEAAVLGELIGTGVRIDLLTNNPGKVAALESHGFSTRARPLIVRDASVRDYLLIKRRLFGHLIDDDDDPNSPEKK